MALTVTEKKKILSPRRKTTSTTVSPRRALKYEGMVLGDIVDLSPAKRKALTLGEAMSGNRLSPAHRKIVEKNKISPRKIITRGGKTTVSTTTTSTTTTSSSDVLTLGEAIRTNKLSPQHLNIVEKNKSPRRSPKKLKMTNDDDDDGKLREENSSKYLTLAQAIKTNKLSPEHKKIIEKNKSPRHEEDEEQKKTRKKKKNFDYN